MHHHCLARFCSTFSYLKLIISVMILWNHICMSIFYLTGWMQGWIYGFLDTCFYLHIVRDDFFVSFCLICRKKFDIKLICPKIFWGCGDQYGSKFSLSSLLYFSEKHAVSRWWFLFWCGLGVACYFFLSLFFPGWSSSAMLLYCWKLTLEPYIVYHNQATSLPAIVNPHLPILLLLQTWLQGFFFSVKYIQEEI